MPELMDDWSYAAIEQNRRWLSAYVLAACGKPDAVEDIIQETFRIALEKRESFQRGTCFSAWLRGIARNCVKRHFESTKRQPVLMGDAFERMEQAAIEATDKLLDSEWSERRIKALRECLAHLTEKARRILEDRYVRDCSAQDVGVQESMSEVAVHVTVFRARVSLSDCLKRKLGQ
ncbi:MAG TPA: sigma-70 family RNA polymerase sigma factor [Planctomycetota bacterium]|nr:sigma-70 family RNA polymerase sigma factor [Planctomycetota bacterium]